ncbi:MULTISPECIES: hypothetical protein [unclassified Janthinobacterium]|uniref:hypothetical protein n=1 Tax=unclassified Janthinobacterium TaxID=2610881 RepID=UPI00160904A9|nr:MULTISPECIES: hypothetical protein [unclassified Janthinobacterium]MBB5608853.1 hypothetical protein [Janthinobacterium sp. S3T4]MBB5615925.1 hypothetical protein [Janthinobacterium sp. S3M3]
MKIRWITGLAVHALGCLLFVFLSWLGFYLYTQLFGGLGSVGIAGAKAWLLVFYAYAGTNLVLALLPPGRIPPPLCAALGVVVLFYLLPQHPLRAMYFSLLAGGLSWLAVLASRKLALRLQA